MRFEQRGKELMEQRGKELMEQRGKELIEQRGKELIEHRGKELIEHRGTEVQRYMRRGMRLIRKEDWNQEHLYNITLPKQHGKNNCLPPPTPACLYHWGECALSVRLPDFCRKRMLQL